MSDYPAGTVLGVWPVTVGALMLDRVDEYGIEWSVTDFKGWGSSTSSGDTTDRPRTHGASAGRWYRQAKEMSISGSIDAPSEYARWSAEQRLQAAITEADTTLVMHEEIARQMTVRLNGDLEIIRTGPYTFDFEIPLLALDPFRYGQTPAVTTKTDGAVVIPNGGNRLSWPVHKIEGPKANPQVTAAGGRLMKVGVTLAAGEFLTIDTKRRKVLKAGDEAQNLRRHFSGDFFGIPPGGLSVTVAGKLTTTSYDTWI